MEGGRGAEREREGGREGRREGWEREREGGREGGMGMRVQAWKSVHTAQGKMSMLHLQFYIGIIRFVLPRIEVIHPIVIRNC